MRSRVVRQAFARCPGRIAHVMRGGALGMLVDQKMNDGSEARLFGQPAMTAPALAGTALRLVVEPALVLPHSENRLAGQATLTQQVNDMLERRIRAKPEAWLWLHQRRPKQLMTHCPRNDTVS